MKRVVFAVLLTTVAVVGAEKLRDWQTGKVLDTEQSRVYLGTIGSTRTDGNVHGTTDGSGNVYGTYSSNSTTDDMARYAIQEVEVIDGGQYVYVVSRLLKWRWSKTANLTVNAPVRFSVEKHSMYVLDDDGKEHKTKIVKRILKTEPAMPAKP